MLSCWVRCFPNFDESMDELELWRLLGAMIGRGRRRYRLRNKAKSTGKTDIKSLVDCLLLVLVLFPSEKRPGLVAIPREWE